MQSIGRSVSDGCVSGDVSGVGLFNSSLKCSTHLSNFLLLLWEGSRSCPSVACLSVGEILEIHSCWAFLLPRTFSHVSCNISLMCYLVSRCSYHRFLAGLVRAEICRTCQSEFLCFRTLALYLVLLFVALLHFWGQILIGVFRRWRSDEMSAPLIILTSCWWKYGRSDFLWHWYRPSLHWSRPWVLSYHSSLLYSRLCVVGKMHLSFCHQHHWWEHNTGWYSIWSCSSWLELSGIA